MRCRTRKPSVTERNHLEQAHYTCTCISPYMIICCNHEQGHAPQKKHMIRISFTLTKQVFTLAMDHPANRSVPDVYPVALQAPCATGCASPFQPSHMLGLIGQSLEASSKMPMPQVASCPLQPSLAPVFSNDMAGVFGVPTFGAPLAEPCNTAIEPGPATIEMHSFGQANPDAQPYQAQAVSGPHGVPNMPCDMSGAFAVPHSQLCSMPQPSHMLDLKGQSLEASSNMPMPQVASCPLQPSLAPVFSNDMAGGFGVPTFGAPLAEPCNTAIELGPATTEMHSLGQANPDAQPYQAQAVSGPHGVPNMPCDNSGAFAVPHSQLCSMPQPSHMLGLKGQSLEASSNMPMPQVASCPLQPSLAPVFSNDMAGGFGVPTFGAPLAEPCNTAIELGPATTEMHSLGQANPDAQPYQAQAVSGPHGVPNMPCDMSGAVAAPPSQPCDMPQPSLMLGPLSQPGLIGQTLGPSSNMPMPQVEPSPMQPSVVPLFSNDMGVGFGVPTFGAPHADPCKCIALAKPVQMYSKVLSICPQPFQAPTKVM